MEYKNIIERFNQYYREAKAANHNLNVFYRGQASDWALKSSLQRKIEEEKEKENEGKKIHDNEMFLKNAIWNENHSVFENIAHMQHYGKPTRLLDFTTSKDVALYFACASEKHMDEDGVVYCCSYFGRHCDICDVKLMMEIAKLEKAMKVDEFVNSFLGKYHEYTSMEWEKLALRILSWTDHGFMIAPTKEEMESLKKWNLRMYSQKGVFFVQSNKILGKDTRAMSRNIPLVTITNELADIPSTISKSRFIDKIVIPHQNKEEILSILNDKGINRESLKL